MQRTTFITLFIFITLICSSCSEEEKNSLAGHWEPVARPYNLGSTLIFEEDSLFTEIKEAKVAYSYELAGDTLISTSLSGLTGEKIIDSARITISGDTLILIRGKIGDQQETVMQRYDSVYADIGGITGTWRWPHQSGRDALSIYHPDGKASVSVTIEKREGKYSVAGDSLLTIVTPGSSLRDIYYELKGDSLFFPDKFAPLGNAFYRVKEIDEE